MKRILFITLSLVLLCGCNNLIEGRGQSTSLSPTPDVRISTTETQGILLESPTPDVIPSEVSTTVLSTPTVATSTPLLPTDTPASPVRFPDPNAYIWKPIVADLNAPIALVNAGDGTGRIYIVEQPGVVRLWGDSKVLPEPFLDIRDRVGSQASEQGLLGLAFHPDYPNNGYFYVNYTDSQGNTVISRFEVSQQDSQIALPGSEIRLLQITQPYRNHNGGMVVFGPDGYLYLGLGDGGSAGDPQGNGQSLTSLLGKILRLDVDNEQPYSIPTDNPFHAGDGRAEIWAYGLRNPWRFSFDTLTGDLYLGDVGQNQWEEINFLPAGSPGGANFGWSYFEGLHPYSNVIPSDLNHIPPVAEYGHELGCSVTGGVVYRGESLPDWQGIYLYGDYCTGNIWGLVQDEQGSWLNSLLFTGIGRITSFGQDELGEVYVVDHDGRILKLVSN